MNDGDRVTGIPMLPEMVEQYPTITGYYEDSPIEGLDGVIPNEFIVVGEDRVSCVDIRPAGRREKDTVL